MARLVPLLLLFLLVITNSYAADELVSSEVDGGGGGPLANHFVCDIIFDLCLGSCWKSGKCMRCCKHYGFIHGRCKFLYGDGCYCCHTPDLRKS